MEKSVVKEPAGKKGSMTDKSFAKSEPTTHYVLVFVDATSDMPAGTEKVINSSYLSLGRDSDCAISFGDKYPMVSRLHAAIEWCEEGYTLRHLSNTNQTLLNGRPVGRKWFLHDDDVIQLAPSGPKIKFKVPLILDMAPEKKGSTNRMELKKEVVVDNVALIAVIVLAVLLTALMVYLTMSGS